MLHFLKKCHNWIQHVHQDIFTKWTFHNTFIVLISLMNRIFYININSRYWFSLSFFINLTNVIVTTVFNSKILTFIIFIQYYGFIVWSWLKTYTFGITLKSWSHTNSSSLIIYSFKFGNYVNWLNLRDFLTI